MKKLSGLIAIFFAVIATSFGQESFANQRDICNSKELIFYGYDYTHFKLSDPKRIGQNIKNFVFVWIDFCNEPVGRKLSKWFLKDKITINQTPTIEINMKLNNDELGAMSRSFLSKDSIQDYINKYKIQEKEGIGFVIIFECFDIQTKTVSAYYTFFDIASKKVLLSDYFISRDGNRYNYVRDWANAVIIALNKYLKEYRAKCEAE